jgi:hypothetical protein
MKLKDKKNPIFIGGYRKSGTTMFICMLDGHNSIQAYPYDSGFFYGCYPSLFNNHQDGNKDQIDGFVQYLCKNDFIDQLKIAGTFDRERMNLDKLETLFRNCLGEILISPKNVLDCFNLAYTSLYKQNDQCNLWVEKTTSSEIYAHKIFSWYPNAKFIHIIRDPRDNFASLKSGFERRYKSRCKDVRYLMQSMLHRGHLGMKLASSNREIYGRDRYMVLKYEDIVNNPKDTMQIVSDFIDIEYSDCLLTPTVLGSPWKGNNFDGIDFQGVSNINVGRWKERITDAESQIIEYHFSDIMDEFGYFREHDLEKTVPALIDHYYWENEILRNFS